MKFPPKSEIQYLSNLILNHPQYLETEYVISEYKKHAKQVITSNESEEIANIIIKALDSRLPLSMIRLGDGELNMLCAFKYPKTHLIDLWSCHQTINFCEHKVQLNDETISKLKKQFEDSILNADVIGVLGIFRFNKPSAKQLSEYLENHIRGVSGQYRGVDYLLSLGNKNVLKNKTIAPAHFYFSVVKHIHQIIKSAQKTYIITNRTGVYHKIKLQHPNTRLKLINIQPCSSQQTPIEPVFLNDVLNQLDNDLSGQLCLIGMGIWSEIIATKVKEKGGVAVDVGSGFNILDGNLLRPLHRKMAFNEIKQYFL